MPSLRGQGQFYLFNLPILILRTKENRILRTPPFSKLNRLVLKATHTYNLAINTTQSGHAAEISLRSFAVKFKHVTFSNKVAQLSLLRCR
jgi:hypothetical protein